MWGNRTSEQQCVVSIRDARRIDVTATPGALTVA